MLHTGFCSLNFPLAEVLNIPVVTSALRQLPESETATQQNRSSYKLAWRI